MGRRLRGRAHSVPWARPSNAGIPYGATLWLDAAFGDTNTSRIAENRGDGGDPLDAFIGPARAVVRDGALVLPGTTGNYASVPDSAALDITGDLEIVARVSLTYWTPSGVNMVLAAKRQDGGNNQSWSLVVTNTGVMTLTTSATGAAPLLTNTSTAAVPFADGATGWVKVTLDVDDGLGNRVAKFYYAADQTTEPSSWTQLGLTVTTAGVASIYAGAAPVEIGSRNAGVNDPLNGQVKRVIVRNGIGGTAVLDVDFNNVTNYASSFTAATGQTVTVTATTATMNDPLWLPSASAAGGAYIHSPGATSNYWSVPDQAAFDAMTELDIRVDAASPWTPDTTGTLVAKYGGAGNRTFHLTWNTDSSMQLILSIDGTDTRTSSSGSQSLVPWRRYQFKATWRGSDGRSQHFRREYTGLPLTDNTGWTQIGPDRTLHAGGTLFNSVTAVNFSTSTAGGAQSWPWNFYGATIATTIDGTPVLNINAATDLTQATESASSFVCTTGQTVTINRATSNRKTVVVGPSGRARWLLGTDDFMEILDNALLNFGASDSFTVVAVGRVWATPSANGRFVNKGTSARWLMYNDGTLHRAAFIINDGTNTAQTYTPTPSAGALAVRAVAMDRASNQQTSYLNGTAGTPVSAASVGSAANANSLYVGSSTGAAGFNEMELFAVALYRRALNATELAQIAATYGAA